MKIFHNFFWKKKYSLVISGGGVRGFYALGVMKALEELGIKKDITHIYGVSIGAILWAYWSAGYSANRIFERFSWISVFWLKTFSFLSKKSLLKNTFLKELFDQDLPDSFEDLNIPLSLGATDANKAKYIVYKKGNLIIPILASMSLPGVFPPIIYEWRILLDGGLINNFPVDIAKKEYPHNKIIWIFLNKFMEDQKIGSLFDTLAVSYEILMRSRDLEKFDGIDYLFCRDLNIPVLSLNKKQMKIIFELGYKDWLENFWNTKNSVT